VRPFLTTWVTCSTDRRTDGRRLATLSARETVHHRMRETPLSLFSVFRRAGK
jgi:hypothetical protein